MNDDELLALIRARAQDSKLPPVATEESIVLAEARLQLRLSSFHRRLLKEIADGGFGPEYGLFSIRGAEEWCPARSSQVRN